MLSDAAAPDELLRPRRDHRAATPGAFWDALKHLILPAIALGSIPLAIVARITRAAVLDVQNEDYVRTARAKGLPPRIVDGRHVLRNALLPVTTIIGLQTGLLLSGAVLTETVFAWPGIGIWLTDAIFNRDYPVLQGGILFVAIVFVARQPARRHLVRDHQPADPATRERRRDRSRRESRSSAPGGLWRDAWSRLRRNPGAIVGFALVAIFVFVAIFAPLIAPYDPRDAGPDADHERLLSGPDRRTLARRRPARPRRAVAASSTARATRS